MSMVCHMLSSVVGGLLGKPFYPDFLNSNVESHLISTMALYSARDHIQATSFSPENKRLHRVV